MFLMQAQRLSRGMARLRHFLILLMRTLAIAGLIFAISRPLATGWLGLVGSRPDTTLILLDRSASMDQKNLATGESKRSTGLAKIRDLLKKFGESTRVVLIESTENNPQEIESLERLMEIPEAAVTSTKADIPAMLEAAQKYIKANQTGFTEVWLCSDLRESDWNPDGGRWESLVSEFAQMQGVRFQILSYDQPPEDNLAVTVRNAKRRVVGRNSELVLDIHLSRRSVSEGPIDVPIEVIVNGNRSVIDFELVENQQTLQGHVIPLDQEVNEGWGRVELPEDANATDNVFHFVFAEPPEYRTAIISEDFEAVEFLRLASIAPADPSLVYSAEKFRPEQLSEVDWNKTAMVVWHAPIPDGLAAQQLTDFANRGGTVIFFPPEQINQNEFFSVKWNDWNQDDSTPIGISTWRGDSDLLSHTQSGAALPVGDLRTFRYCSLSGEGTRLATYSKGDAMLLRASNDAATAYFCSTLPQVGYSNLVQDGVVLYVMMQRALNKGAMSLGTARHLDAGSSPATDAASWSVLSSDNTGKLPSTRKFGSGAYQAEKSLVALNRPETEDEMQTIGRDTVDRLFTGLDYRHIDDQVGNSGGLASEMWRAFLFVMGLALMLEAVLCLPPRKTAEVAI